jgi:hypothetical protein
MIDASRVATVACGTSGILEVIVIGERRGTSQAHHRGRWSDLHTANNARSCGSPSPGAPSPRAEGPPRDSPGQRPGQGHHNIVEPCQGDTTRAIATPRVPCAPVNVIDESRSSRPYRPWWLRGLILGRHPRLSRGGLSALARSTRQAGWVVSSASDGTGSWVRGQSLFSRGTNGVAPAG